MHGVERRLVAGIRVDGGHHAALNTEGGVQDVHDRGQAVGGARCIRDDKIVLGQRIVVHTIDDGLVGTCGRSRDENALGAGFEMKGGLFTRGEDAGAFHHDVDVEIAPGEVLGVALGENLEAVAAFDLDGVAINGDFLGEAAVDGIEAHQVCVGFDRAEIVDRDHVDVLATRFVDRAHDVAADTSETVDRYPSCHMQCSLFALSEARLIRMIRRWP